MKKGILGLSICFIASLIFADNVNMQNNGTFVNNGTVTNNQGINEKEKAESDLKIAKLATTLMNNPKREDSKTLQAVLNAANKANEFNISKEDKRQKCVEYSLSIGFFKVDAKLAKKECEEIF